MRGPLRGWTVGRVLVALDILAFWPMWLGHESPGGFVRVMLTSLAALSLLGAAVLGIKEVRARRRAKPGSSAAPRRAQ